MDCPLPKLILACVLAATSMLPAGPVCAAIPIVEDVAGLEAIVDAAWTNSGTAKIMPPGTEYGNDLGAIGFASGFSQDFLASLAPVTNGPVVLYSVRVAETNIAGRTRCYLNATNACVHTTAVSVVGYPEAWIEATYGEPPGWLSGAGLTEWYGDRDPMRQQGSFILVATNSIADYLAQLAEAVPAWEGGGTNVNLLALYSNDIAFVQLNAGPGGAALYVHAPAGVPVVDVYKSTNLLEAYGWTLPATLDMVTDPLLWLYSGPDAAAFFAAGDPSVDTDGDGLADIRERRLFGTDPDLADTDGDGLNDGLEIQRYGMDALSRDTDGDGMLDGYEVQHLLNPHVNNASDDPDGDGLSNIEEQSLGLDPNDKADGVALRETARARIVASWYMVMTNELSFTNTPGSPADLNDMKSALNQLSGKFYRAQTQ